MTPPEDLGIFRLPLLYVPSTELPLVCDRRPDIEWWEERIYKSLSAYDSRTRLRTLEFRTPWSEFLMVDTVPRKVASWRFSVHILLRNEHTLDLDIQNEKREQVPYYVWHSMHILDLKISVSGLGWDGMDEEALSFCRRIFPVHFHSTFRGD